MTVWCPLLVDLAMTLLGLPSHDHVVSIFFCIVIVYSRVKLYGEYSQSTEFNRFGWNAQVKVQVARTSHPYLCLRWQACCIHQDSSSRCESETTMTHAGPNTWRCTHEPILSMPPSRVELGSTILAHWNCRLQTKTIIVETQPCTSIDHGLV